MYFGEHVGRLQISMIDAIFGQGLHPYYNLPNQMDVVGIIDMFPVIASVTLRRSPFYRYIGRGYRLSLWRTYPSNLQRNFS